MVYTIRLIIKPIQAIQLTSGKKYKSASAPKREGLEQKFHKSKAPDPRARGLPYGAHFSFPTVAHPTGLDRGHQENMH